MLESLHHGRTVNFRHGLKSRFHHPIGRFRYFKTAALFRIHENMHGKSGSPCRAGAGFIEESVLDNETATRFHMKKRLLHEMSVGLESLIVKNVRHQHSVVWAAPCITIEIARDQSDTRLKSRFPY